MRIGIFTFHRAINYGAVLQAYGLKAYLESLGHEAYVIDYRPKYMNEYNYLFQFNKISFVNIKQALCDLLRELIIIPIRYHRLCLFRTFCKKRLGLKNIELDVQNNDFDVFVFGSDQIWNPVITNGYDNVYFGNFKAAEGKICVSYAASCGSIDNIRKEMMTICTLLSTFSSISVREKNLSRYLVDNLSQLNVFSCIDPVLLAGRDAYDRILEDFTVNEKYLLLFQLYHNEELFQNAFKIACQNDLKLVEITSNSESFKKREMVNVVSPGRFLAYIKNASYIITSSYHGMVLSILYSKDFNAVCYDDSIAERFMDLLTSLDMTDRLVDRVEKLTKIDYSRTENNFNKLRSSAQDYISNALRISRK